MTTPTIGVLITYHDEGELLKECVASFLSQTPPPDEIIIFDDASASPAQNHVPPEFTGKILHSPTTIGPARARNLLWKESRSMYVHFHDADDVVLPGWSPRVRTPLEDGVDVVFTEIQSRQGPALLSPAVLGLRFIHPATDLVRFCLEGSMLVCAGTYRRSFVESVGGYRERLWQSEDFDFNVRAAARLMAVSPAIAHYRVIIDPLVEIRIRPGSRSQDFRGVWKDAITSIECLLKELPKEYASDLVEAVSRVGAESFRLGARDDARRAFTLAAQWGTPVYPTQGRAYRWIARHFGPQVAESMGLMYRRLVPVRFREDLRRAATMKKAA